MRHLKWASVAAASFGLACGIAQAKTVTINITLADGQYEDGSAGGVFAAPFQLSVGDTLDLSITLPVGHSLTIATPNYLEMAVYPNEISAPNGEIIAMQTTSEFYFLDPIGPANVPTPPVTLLNAQESTRADGSYHDLAYVRGLFYAPELSSGPGAISFSGFRMVSHIDALTELNPSYGPVDALMSEMYFHDWDVLYGGVPVTIAPEPATWAMLMLGIGMLGLAARRRNAAIAAVT